MCIRDSSGFVLVERSLTHTIEGSQQSNDNIMKGLSTAYAKNPSKAAVSYTHLDVYKRQVSGKPTKRRWSMSHEAITPSFSSL